jgi:hypothetical protein
LVSHPTSTSATALKLRASSPRRRPGSEGTEENAATGESKGADGTVTIPFLKKSSRPLYQPTRFLERG